MTEDNFFNTSGAQVRRQMNEERVVEMKSAMNTAQIKQVAQIIDKELVQKGFTNWLNYEIAEAVKVLVDIPDGDPKSGQLKAEIKAYRKVQSRINNMLTLGKLHAEEEKEVGQSGDT